MPIRFACGVAFLSLGFLISGCARDPLGDLLDRLGDSDVGVRRAAARALDEQPNVDDRVVAALTKSADDDDVEVRYLSIDARGKIGPAAKSSVPVLTSALQDPEKPVRLRAALAMQRIDPNDRSFLPALTSLMREGDGKTLLAVGALGADAAWAVPTLTGLLSHQSAKVRALAANTLGRIGPAASGAKGALQGAVREPNAAVKRAAQDALNRIQTRSPTETK